MIVKGAFLLLAFMAVLAIFGRLRYPGRQRLQAMKCPRCGRYRIGRSACDCGGGSSGRRG